MGVRFEAADFIARMHHVQQRTLFGCLSYGKAAAMKMEKAAKKDYPWKFRTHAADHSLNGDASVLNGHTVSIRLSHGVSYGVYLELIRFRHKGNLGIVFPTVQKMSPEIMEGWAAVVRRGGG